MPHNSPVHPLYDWSDLLRFVEILTGQVGQELLRFFGQVQPQEKEDGSLITQADRWADQALREAITHQFPDHGLLTEETAGTFPDRPWCWVIDPLDGTTNFARKVPIWGISLGLLYQGQPVFGYVAIPPLGENFHGFWPGDSNLDWPKGAWCNHQPIRVFGGEPTKNLLFSFCTRSIHNLRRSSSPNVAFPCKIRMLGVATYNLLTVASGICVGGVEATPKVWDMAATWVICQGAGAEWIHLRDNPFPLVAGGDYHHISYPALVLGRSAWVDRFAPYLLPWSV